MAGEYLTALADISRYMGLETIEVPGWQTRSRKSGGYQRKSGISVHHTAESAVMDGASSSNYMTFSAAARPISNLYVARRGAVYVQAAGATNTVGAGGPYHGIGIDQGNAETIGIEIGNNGIGEPYPDVQCDAVVLLCAGIWAFYGPGAGWGIELGRIFAHFEWAPGRKIDPRGPSRFNDYQNTYWDMNRFRSAVASIIWHPEQSQPEAPPPPPPPPAPDPAPPGTPGFIETGLYRLNAGDSPWSVAALAYGDGRQHARITESNQGNTWQVGNQVWVPGRSGWVVEVMPGDGWYALIGRTGLPKTQANLDRVLLWNSGATRVLRPGDQVFIPNQ